MLNILERTKISSFLLLITHIVVGFLLVVFVLNGRQFPYADDWAYVAPLSMSSIKEFIVWVFSQHVDHRIPVQKAIQYSLARLFDFDFRVLVLFNVVVALLTSLALTAAARVYRGYQHYGDAVIPLIIMTPAAVYSLWAFQFQFLSSIFFVATSVYFACKYSETGKSYNLSLAIIQLFICALCGMNGAIFSSVLIAGVITYLIGEKELSGKTFYTIKSLVALVVIENIVVWSLWSPTSATGVETNIVGLIEIFFKLLPASMAVFTFSGMGWKIAVILLGLMLVVYLSVHHFGNEKRSFSDFFLRLALLASLLVILSVAIGRSKAQGGWNNVLAMHYGYLTVLLPILTWLFVSKRLGPKFSALIGLVGVIIFARAYQENYIWRHDYALSIYENTQLVNNALRDESEVKALVDRYALDFTWKNNNDAKQPVVDAISTLRAKNYKIYKPNNPPFTLFSVATDQEMGTRTAFLVNSKQVADNYGWIESGDFDRTKLGKYIVYGSYRTSDSDKGKLSFTVQPGQHILFRSGPRTEYQRIEVSYGGKSSAYTLPVTSGWARLEFDSNRLRGEFSISFHDDGAAWGEWSAVAIGR